MDNATADRLYRPEFVTFIDLYLQAKTKMESEILFQNVKMLINQMKEDNVMIPIQFHYVCSAISTSRIFWKINMGPQIMNILRIIEELYPDEQTARSLAKQIIIVSGKMSARLN